MPTWNVTLGGTTLEAVTDVERESGDAVELGRAVVTAANTDRNRGVPSSAVAEVDRNGETIFRGRLTKKPTTGERSDFLEFVIGDQRAELGYEEVHRPFVQRDSGALVADVIDNRASRLDPVTIHRGSDAANWSSDTPVFELADFEKQTFREYGSNLLFVGWRSEASGVYTVTYSDVPSDAVPGPGQLFRLKTRLLVNNVGDNISGEVELTDPSGLTMVWELPRLQPDFETYDLRAEDARSDANIGSVNGTAGTLEYRFRVDGGLPESRGALLDHAETLPFSLASRQTPLTSNDVQTTGRTITRRFDEDVMSVISTLAREDKFTSYVDLDDDIHYEPSGEQGTPFIIDESTTPVTDYNVDRDYDGIVNKVTVQGDDDIQVTAQDRASIQFYGLAAREETIVDREIQTEREARERARGVLEDKAWTESALTFEVADTAWDDISVGRVISVSWPSENVDGEFVVSSVETDAAGFVTVKFSGNAEVAF